MNPPSVRIVQLDAATLSALADGDLARARETSPAPLSDYLVAPESVGTWRMRAEQVVTTPEDADWVTGVVLVDDVPVGKAGYHSAPQDGAVEVGYAIDPAFRRRGYARAALGALLARARQAPEVSRVIASVSPENEPSLNLIAQYGFVRTGEQWDEEDGLEWVFEVGVGELTDAP